MSHELKNIGVKLQAAERLAVEHRYKKAEYHARLRKELRARRGHMELAELLRDAINIISVRQVVNNAKIEIYRQELALH